MYGQDRIARLRRKSEAQIVKAKDKDLDKKIIAVGTVAIFAAQVISAIVFLSAVIKKPFRSRR